MANQKFTEEYGTIQTLLKNEVFAENAKQMVTRLGKLLGDDGPDKAYAGNLSKFHSQCKRGFFDRLFGANRAKESDGLMAIAGGDTNLGRKCGALKALRHLHMMTKFGGHCLWVMNLPKTYRQWAIDELSLVSKANLPAKLNQIDGYFSIKGC